MMRSGRTCTVMPVQILIADDHSIIREGLRALLETDTRIRVVGLARNGREAIDAARRLRPDVVIMDVAMADMNGIDAIDPLLAAAPRARVVMLSMHTSAEYVYRALHAGAAGYLVKNAATAEILEAIPAVLSGRTFLSSEIRALERRARPRDRHRPSPLESLSARERQVLQLVAEGHSSSRIAAAINLSPKTVETYRSRLMKKLGVNGVAGLARFAVEHGLTPPE